MSVKSLSIGTKGIVSGTEESVRSFSIETIDKAFGTSKSVNSFSVPLVLFCIIIHDSNDMPVEGAELFLNNDPNTILISDANGLIRVGLRSDVANVSKSGFSSVSISYDFDSVLEGECIIIKLEPDSGMATFRIFEQIVEIPSSNNFDFCFCNVECEYKELSVVDMSSNDNDKNDFSSFLFKKLVDQDSIEIQLFKNDSFISIIDDDTYGKFYDGFDNEPLFTGALIEWKKVVQVHGYGLYQIKTEKTIVGQDSVEESRKFRVVAYSEQIVNGSITFESIQTGNIIGGINYSDLLENGWVQRFRIKGRFSRTTPILTIDEPKSTRYKHEQMISSIDNRYELATGLFPPELYKLIIEDNLLANSIKVSSFNIMDEKFTDLDVRLIEMGELTNEPNNRNYLVSAVFGDRTADIVKRNF